MAACPGTFSDLYVTASSACGTHVDRGDVLGLVTGTLPATAASLAVSVPSAAWTSSSRESASLSWISARTSDAMGPAPIPTLSPELTWRSTNAIAHLRSDRIRTTTRPRRRASSGAPAAEARATRVGARPEPSCADGVGGRARSRERRARRSAVAPARVDVCVLVACELRRRAARRGYVRLLGVDSETPKCETSSRRSEAAEDSRAAGVTVRPTGQRSRGAAERNGGHRARLDGQSGRACPRRPNPRRVSPRKRSNRRPRHLRRCCADRRGARGAPPPRRRRRPRRIRIPGRQCRYPSHPGTCESRTRTPNPPVGSGTTTTTTTTTTT